MSDQTVIRRVARLSRACSAMQPASELGSAELLSAGLVPRWVSDAVVKSHYPAFADLKCAFFLLPSEVRRLLPREACMQALA